MLTYYAAIAVVAEPGPISSGFVPHLAHWSESDLIPDRPDRKNVKWPFGKYSAIRRIGAAILYGRLPSDFERKSQNSSQF